MDKYTLFKTRTTNGANHPSTAPEGVWNGKTNKGMENNAFMAYMQRQQTARLPQGFNSFQRQLCVTSHECRFHALAKHIPSSLNKTFFLGTFEYSILVSLVSHNSLVFFTFLFSVCCITSFIKYAMVSLNIKKIYRLAETSC
jgi:hypothetical protein